LIDYTGNNTRLIFTELEKLKIYALGKTVNGDMVKELVSKSAANRLKLANAIRLNNIAQALEFLERLINCNEPALKITATLTSTFRTWLTIKQMMITGCQDDNTIAQLADVKNPKRLYYIRQEVANCCVKKLKKGISMLFLGLFVHVSICGYCGR
jgi:DNA polymerase III subunit delta